MLLAGLIILAHQVLPHRHHYSVCFELENHSLHHYNHLENSHNDPVHCHAFNELFAEKSLALKIKKQVQQASTDLLLLAGINLPEIFSGQPIHITCPTPGEETGALLVDSPLRAPPAFFLS